MWNRSQLRSTRRGTALVVAFLLLSAAVIAGSAAAQSLPLPSTSTSPTGGVDLTTGPDGLKVGLDAGDTGGVTVGAGQGGVNLGVRPPRTGTATPPAAEPGSPVSNPDRPAGDTPRRDGPGSAGTPGPGTLDVVGATPGAAGRSGSAAARAERAGERGGSDASRSAEGRQAAARAKREERGGVAPVFDLVESIPAAVRYGLVALGVIAVAMWALWVRGRRRLEHNAYQDPDTGVANMAAFEQVLDREWQRAARYRRPLGLLLLELEPGSGGIRLLGERDARAAVDDINEEVRESDIVARLAPSRFAVICPEAPQGSVETLAHALEGRLEGRRLRCWAGFGERSDADDRPADLVTRAAAALSDVQGQGGPGDEHENETLAFPVGGRAAAA